MRCMANIMGGIAVRYTSRATFLPECIPVHDGWKRLILEIDDSWPRMGSSWSRDGQQVQKSGGVGEEKSEIPREHIPKDIWHLAATCFDQVTFGL